MATKSKPMTQPTISLRARDWTLRMDNAPTGSLVSEVHPSSLRTGGLFFNFPNDTDSPGWNCDYVTVPYTTSIKAAGIRFSGIIEFISGQPQFQDPDGEWPSTGLAPNFRIMLQHRDSEDRWWNGGYHYLQAGVWDLESGFANPAAWINQNGRTGDTIEGSGSFADTLASIGRIGITMGSGSDFGHGVFTKSGTARFTLTDARFV